MSNGGIAFGMPGGGIAFGMPGVETFPAPKKPRPSICRSCLGTDCVGGYSLDDLDLYSLQGDPFLWVLNCPPGFSCTPDPSGGTVSMACCDDVLTASFPPNVSAAEYTQIVSSLIQQCAARLPFCGGKQPPTPPPPDGPVDTVVYYWNRSVGCTVKCPADQLPFTYTIRAGLFIGTSQLNADRAAFKQACTLAKQHLICLGDFPTTACVGTAFNGTIRASGAGLADTLGVNFWSVSGTLPPGLTFNGGFLAAGYVTITGTPTTVGSYTFTVSVTSPQGDSMSKTYTICVIGQTASPSGSDDTNLPDASSNTAYTVTLTAPSCATGPFSWQLKSGDVLPQGLNLDETTGIISGTPTTPGIYSFTIILQTEAT